MENSKSRILWVDDEIDLLKPYVILLKQRNYEIETATNGEDAIELVKETHFDLVFLDETMVGITGLETLQIIKKIDPSIPVVMVTKNEAETLMDDAIGNKIDDYLTKPVNPTQIILACKKFLEKSRISEDKFNQDYIQGFSQISREINFIDDWDEWVKVFTRLTNWSMELDRLPDSGLKQTLHEQWRDCNAAFCRFVERDYRDWLNVDSKEAYPIQSPHILDNYVKPFLQKGEKVFFIVIDCMRYDQWLVMAEMLSHYFSIDTDFYSSILPTSTQFARNSIFSALYPDDIKKHYPQWWNSNTNTEEVKLNAYEAELMEAWIDRRRLKLKNKPHYTKIYDTSFGMKIERELPNLMTNQLNSLVINAVDMIAHSRSDHAILKEIAPDESAYRNLTKTWFKHSSLFGIFKQLSQQKDMNVVVTTDHGAIRCMRGVKVLGDRDTSTNLRYKFGKNVRADERYAVQIANPADYKLPTHGITVNNLIAKEDFYFVYPTDFHHYLNRYRDSFQHGGISMEEMILPIAKLKPHKR